jgi:glycerol-3-phosphate responsive antiterminator
VTRSENGVMRATTLPQILVADDGRHPIELPDELEYGLLLRDTELAVVVARAASAAVQLAVDIDTVRGLGADDAAVEFIVRRLGIEIVLTRRSATALHAARVGGLALLHVLAFDSTGLHRSLDGHPRTNGVGTVVSPGLVLSHMGQGELESLSRPILGYGLITEPTEVDECLGIADGVALRPEAARIYALDRGSTVPSRGNVLTTVSAR